MAQHGTPPRLTLDVPRQAVMALADALVGVPRALLHEDESVHHDPLQSALVHTSLKSPMPPPANKQTRHKYRGLWDCEQGQHLEFHPLDHRHNEKEKLQGPNYYCEQGENASFH